MWEMKSETSIQLTNEDNCWTPFQNSLSVWMQPTTQNDMTEILLHSMSSSTVVGANLFFDIICPTTSN